MTFMYVYFMISSLESTNSMNRTTYSLSERKLKWYSSNLLNSQSRTNINFLIVSPVHWSRVPTIKRIYDVDFLGNEISRGYRPNEKLHISLLNKYLQPFMAVPRITENPV